VKSTDFPQSNSALHGGPPEAYGTDGPVLDLPVYIGGGEIISRWRLTWRERLAVLIGGDVWLRVLAARTQPPVCLQVENPWEPGGDR
jgi:hypothetical protein